MEARHERAIIRLSAVLLIGAAPVIALGHVGVGPGPLVGLGVALLAVPLYLARSAGVAGRYLAGLWVGPLVGLAITLLGVATGATPGEYQALGGIAGLVAVGNLLLRPVYRLGHGLAVELLDRRNRDRDRRQRR